MRGGGTEPRGAALRDRALSILLGIAVVAYPVGVYFGLRQGSARNAALLLLLVFVPAALVRLMKLRRMKQQQEKLSALALLPVITVLLLGASAALDAGGFILAVPTVVNLLLLLVFGATLRFGPPMIERFARLQEPELSPPKMRWCLLWTRLWCGFFLFNGGAAAALAMFAPLEVWTAYTGLVAYALMGVLFALEFGLRRLRFGRAVTS